MWKQQALNPYPRHCWRTGKIAYDKKGAITASHSPVTMRKLDHKNIRYYHCNFCNAWHLTTQSKRKI